MRATVLAAALLAAPVAAQTQGVPNFNDYTVECILCSYDDTWCGLPTSSGGTSGSTTGDPSTKLAFDLSNGGQLKFTVDGAAGSSFVFLLYNVAPCPTLQFPLAKLTYPISNTANWPLTNQTLDMSLIPTPTPLLTGVPNPFGDFTAVVPFPSTTFGCPTICTQAVIFDPGAISSGFVVTQAYEIKFR